MKLLTLTVFNAVFAAAAILAWPIYEDASFIVLVAVALAVSNLVAWLSVWRTWTALRTVLTTIAAYVVLGVPLAIPSAMTDPLSFIAGLGQLFTAPITAWKDLLTLSLPVASYQTVLVPALLLFLAVPVASLRLALGARRVWMLAPVLALLPLLFAATFGSSATSPALILPVVNIQAPVEVFLTLGSALLLLLWIAQRRHPRPGQVTLVLAFSTIAALVIAPTLMATATRDVFRVRINPLLEVQRQNSPLSVYRASFTDELIDTSLFNVSGGSNVARVRIATLSGYDGQVATVDMSPPSATQQTETFARVPALVDPAPLGGGGKSEGSLTIKIGALRGIWVPTTTSLTGISFTGERATALSDGFFYNPSLGAGIQLANPGLASGVQYTLRTQEAQEPSLASLSPGLATPRIAQEFVPESLLDWIAQQRVPRTGAGLESLIQRLRERGYLSHALTIDAANPPEWMLELPGYSFQPSRAGHSSARIDQLFTQLRDREREVGTEDPALLVAAPGDDEQFAVAAMLIADQLGFNARVVLGTRLTDQVPSSNARSAEPAIPACSQGDCTGANLSAWLEVQGESGEWVSVDVTPQYEQPLAPKVDRLQDPQVVTEVAPPSVDAVQPPESAPTERDGAAPDPLPAGFELTWLWVALNALAFTLVVLLVFLGPLLVILVFKHLRSKARRQSADPKDAILGGWNEYVDTEVDFGRPIPPNRTRSELATLYSLASVQNDGAASHHSPSEHHGERLATLADRAVFGDEPVTDSDAATYWQLLDVHMRTLKSDVTRRERWRAALSLRSLTRWVWPRRVEESRTGRQAEGDAQ